MNCSNILKVLIPFLILIICEFKDINCDEEASDSHRNKRFLWGFGGFDGGGLGFQNYGWDQYNPVPRISDCPTTDGNRTGICVKSVSECSQRGGRAVGTCYATPTSGTNQNSQNIGNLGNNYQYPGIPVGICCYYQVTCGGTILQNGTYFRNPNAPAPYTDARACSVTVQRLRRDVCQLRLDFLVFDLGRPRDGTCETDRFVVNGQSQNSIIPPICGYNTGQHMYIDLSTNTGPVTLNVLSMGNRNRVFDIRVSQINCASTYKSPPNCLQYHIGVQGYLKSFNFEDLNIASTGYLNNMDYTICFRKEPGFCTVTYSVPVPYIDQQINQPNQDQGQQPSTPGRFFNIVPETSTNNPVGNDQAGAGPFECANDFLLLASTRLCGSRLNSQVYPAVPNPSTNAEVTDNSTGPIFARFVSSSGEVGRGFFLNYRMNPCLING